jgi:ribonuclease Z
VCLIWRGEGILFDVGEGTQRQMAFAGISLLKIKKMLVTHIHGDHVLGIPGILMSMSLLNRESSLDIYGPAKLKVFLSNLVSSVRESLTFQINLHEVTSEGMVCRGRDYSIFSCRADHVYDSWAYKFVEDPRPGKFDEKKAEALGLGPSPKRRELVQGREVVVPDGRVIKPSDVVSPSRPGFSMVYTGDTAPSESIIKFSKGVDVLIHESTFSKDKESRASELKHSTSTSAARIAKQSDVKLLVLTHISARYEDLDVLKKEAQEIFPNVEIAEDLKIIEVD